MRPSVHGICSPVIGCRARATAVARRSNAAGSANTRPMRRMIDWADMPTRPAGSSRPNMAPKLRLRFVTVPCSSVMRIPGMAEAIRQFRRSVWSASAACERSISLRSRRKPVKTVSPPIVTGTGVSSVTRSVPSARRVGTRSWPVNSSGSPVAT